jgi:hypothetical protein
MKEEIFLVEKNTAPLPRNGSMYVSKREGKIGEVWLISHLFPPAHLRNGFAIIAES